MASKLFRAVVGVGIVFGAASAACFGAVDDAATASDGGAAPDGAAPSTRLPPAPPSTGSADDDGGAPVAADASVDVGIDAPKDAGPDAFCDAAWPTTKGNPGPPACVDPSGACADAGFPTYCWKDDGTGACDFGQSLAPFCVAGQWQCQPGTLPAADCR